MKRPASRWRMEPHLSGRLAGLPLLRALLLLLMLCLALTGCRPESPSSEVATTGSQTVSTKSPVRLRVFAGGRNQRPDLMRQRFDRFEQLNPGLRIELETGGATSDLQRQYLSTVLNARDSSLDLFLVDVVSVWQYADAGWLEPLEPWLPEGNDPLREVLPAYAQVNRVRGRVMALPAMADAMFLYYRRDLLEKYALSPPETWQALTQVVQTIRAGESDPTLQGLSIQAAPVEGTVCTFLLPYWSQGKHFNDASGKLTLDVAAAARGLNFWLQLKRQGILKRNVAEVTTPMTVNEFKAGQVLFGISWGFAWSTFQSSPDSKVKDRVGVMPLPAHEGGRQVTCMGGWQWGVSAFSAHKAEAARLAAFLSSRETSRFLAAEGSLLPIYADLYTDAEVVTRVPWFAQAAPVVEGGMARPLSSRYPQVSDIVRVNTNAVLAEVKTPEEGAENIRARLLRVMP